MQHNPREHNRNPYCGNMRLTDYGARPFVLNINQATKHNHTYRTALWTGKNLQVTLMSLHDEVLKSKTHKGSLFIACLQLNIWNNFFRSKQYFVIVCMMKF